MKKYSIGSEHEVKVENLNSTGDNFISLNTHGHQKCTNQTLCEIGGLTANGNTTSNTK